MLKAFAVGEKQLILGFKGVGFEIVPLDDSSKLAQVLISLARDEEPGFVVVTESMAESNSEAIDEFRRRSTAVLTIIPTHEGSRHSSFQEIRKSVERSLGIDILGKDMEDDRESPGEEAPQTGEDPGSGIGMTRKPPGELGR